MKVMHCVLLSSCILLSGCPPFKTTEPSNTAQACEIVPPDSFGTSEQKNKRTEAQAGLSKIGSASVVNENEFKKSVNKTYQTVEDKDVACAMLLKTLTCLSNNGVSKETLDDFQQYLTDTKSCTRTDEAEVSVDSIMQLTQKKYGERKKSIILDVLLRNSGDKPAIVSNVTLRFDEHDRPSRAPADMLRVSGVYVVTVSGKGTSVTANSPGRSLEESASIGPANAYYPGPGVNSLIISSPIGQSLAPRTVDRFQVQIDFLEDSDIRGEMKTVRAEITYNNNEYSTSKTIALKP